MALKKVKEEQPVFVCTLEKLQGLLDELRDKIQHSNVDDIYASTNDENHIVRFYEDGRVDLRILCETFNYAELQLETIE